MSDEMSPQEKQAMAYAPFLMLVMICSVDGEAGSAERARLQAFIRAEEGAEFVKYLEEVGGTFLTIVQTLLSPETNFGDELVRLKEVMERWYSSEDALTQKLILVRLAKELADRRMWTLSIRSVKRKSS